MCMCICICIYICFKFKSKLVHISRSTNTDTGLGLGTRQHTSTSAQTRPARWGHQQTNKTKNEKCERRQEPGPRRAAGQASKGVRENQRTGKVDHIIYI